MRPPAFDPVIIAAKRSAIGRYGGALKDLRPDDMLAHIIRSVTASSKIDPNDLDEIIIGCANQAGEDNRNIARMAGLLSGLPASIPAITLNRLCASGLDAIISGARRIICGEAQLVICGGVESMSRAPYVFSKSDKAYKLGAPQIFDSSLGWRFFNKKMREITEPEHNGVTAERLAERYKISRHRQDAYALLSHQRAISAQKNNIFDDEILGLKNLKNSQGQEYIFDQDEGPRDDTSLEKLASLKPAFVKDGTVTAGNSSSLNDGAAVLVLASMAYANNLGIKPLARVLGFASAGVSPQVMGIGPVPATEKLFKNFKLTMNDITAVEINEAFSAQVLAVADLLNIDHDQLNINGGAIALGHPLGCSGARITGTMVHHLQRTKKNIGLVSLCVGVGQGVSMAIEAL